MKVVKIVLTGFVLSVAGIAGAEDASRTPIDDAKLVRDVSRSIFASQKAEVREAERIGIADLADSIRELKEQLKESKKELNRIPSDLAPLRIVGENAAVIQESVPNTPSVEQRKVRLQQFKKLRRIQLEIKQKRENMRAKITGSKSHKQRLLAQSLVARMESLDIELSKSLKKMEDSDFSVSRIFGQILETEFAPGKKVGSKAILPTVKAMETRNPVQEKVR